MATGKEIRDRVFAMSGAILFFVTACALTVTVILSSAQESKQQEAATETAETCQSNSVEKTYPDPEVFKPEGDVTELGVTDLVPGDGDAAKKGDCLVMKYYGTLAATGAMFDENYSTTTGFAFELGAGRVIKGWDQGLEGMKVGGERRLVIPSEQAYGEQAQGEQIPANSDLVFVVKLLRIQK